MNLPASCFGHGGGHERIEVSDGISLTHRREGRGSSAEVPGRAPPDLPGVDVKAYERWGYETRGVLAGAYKGASADLKSTLTHLVEVEQVGPDVDDVEVMQTPSCVKKIHLADPDMDTVYARPTCPRCAKRYDKLGIAAFDERGFE